MGGEQRDFACGSGLPLPPAAAAGWERNLLAEQHPARDDPLSRSSSRRLSPDRRRSPATWRGARRGTRTVRLVGAQIQFHAAKPYSWISPPRRSRRLIWFDREAVTSCERRKRDGVPAARAGDLPVARGNGAWARNRPASQAQGLLRAGRPPARAAAGPSGGERPASPPAAGQPRR